MLSGVRSRVGGTVDVFVQEIEPLDDQIHGTSFRVRIVGERTRADIALEMNEIAGAQVLYNIRSKVVLETNNGVPCRSFRAARQGLPAVQGMKDRQDERFFVRLDGADAHDCIPCEGPAHRSCLPDHAHHRHQGAGPRCPKGSASPAANIAGQISPSRTQIRARWRPY
jgi:hypothetical protein